MQYTYYGLCTYERCLEALSVDLQSARCRLYGAGDATQRRVLIGVSPFITTYIILTYIPKFARFTGPPLVYLLCPRKYKETLTETLVKSFVFKAKFVLCLFPKLYRLSASAWNLVGDLVVEYG